MIKIQTLNKIAAIGTDNFDKSKYVVSDSVENPDAILVRSASMHEMEFGSNLLAIARAGAGVNNIPVDKCTEAGICVFNTPGANANAVKELVIAGLLLSSRKVPQAMDWVKTLKGKGDEVPKLVEKGKGDFAGPEIMGKTLGVIGLGAIGVLVANAAISLGMKVMGYDPFLSLKAAWGLSPAVIYSKTLKEIYENCDYITVHVPYNGDTKEMLCAEAFASMKSGVRILNFARGELVNDADMLSALESGKVAAYVTDFPNDALIGAKNVVTIPHLGASTPESEDNCAYMAAVQLIDYIENGNIKNSVNLPDAEMSASGTKVCIIHKNIPTLISQITAALGSEKINIENMLNKSKKEYAYTMIDASGAISEKVISMLNSIEGVIKVRVI
ncbi:MAG: D-3-phosphoglycerate dehydrogenase / 2-oxoglutarate reductase [Clostridiales bacterium]|jgi:D-3-phosphoglycerate dehydrogenase|nr:Phosphoglycerate dehydrogenase and related dehydrogenase [Oscillospiraceae bacterium]MDN5378257.1 D-3-phosphoglycerate dehydrogenase / 2-oxoglutarate reductase [Clostridiales bacterium]